jgi:hypothetical protein
MHRTVLDFHHFSKSLASGRSLEEAHTEGDRRNTGNLQRISGGLLDTPCEVRVPRYCAETLRNAHVSNALPNLRRGREMWR